MLLGSVYAHRDRTDEAEQLYKTALQIREKFYGPNHTRVASVLHELGKFYREHKKFDVALPLDQRALSIDEGHSEATTPRSPLFCRNLPRFVMHKGIRKKRSPYSSGPSAILIGSSRNTSPT